MACYTNTVWTLNCTCGSTDIQYYDCSGNLVTIDPAACAGTQYTITYDDSFGFPTIPTCDIGYSCNCSLTQVPPSPSPTPSETPSLTPTSSVTPSETPSLTPSSSPPEASPSSTPTPTPSPTPTSTPSPTPPSTPSATATPSATPAATPSVSATPAATPSVTSTPGATPSVSATPAPTPSVSATPAASISVTPSVTFSPSRTPSITPSSNASPSITPTPTKTPVATPSVTPSVSPSTTPSLTPNASVSNTPSKTPSVTPSVTPSSTPAGSPSVTPSVTPSTTASPTPSPTRTAPASVSVTPSKTPSVTPSKTPAASVSVTPSVTPSRTPSPSFSPSPSPSSSLLVNFLAPESPPDTGFDTENEQDQIIVDNFVPPSPSPTPSLSPSPTPTPSVTPSGTPVATPSITPTPSSSPSVTPSKSIKPTPSVTPTPTPSATRIPQPISNTSFTNFNIYNLNEVLFSTGGNDGGGSNNPNGNKNADEYVSNTIINKALLKLITNNKVLTSYLNFRFTGTVDSATGIITSNDILPLTKTEKDLVNYIFNSGCFVNVNEKTAPQVLNRVFECLYSSSKNIIDVTNIKITNLNQLLTNTETLPGLSPSITPSPSLTPSLTPSRTPSVSITPSLTPSSSITPSKTPSLSPSTSPIPVPPASYYTLRVINGLINSISTIGTFEVGTTVTLTANTPPFGYDYASPVWSGDTGDIGNVNSASTDFTGSSSTTYTVYANFVPEPSASPSPTPTPSPSPSTPASPSPTPSPTPTPTPSPSEPGSLLFSLTMNRGTANGSSTLINQPINTSITLAADPAPADSDFSLWTGTGSKFVVGQNASGLGNPNATWVATQGGSYELTATYSTVTVNNYTVSMVNATVDTPTQQNQTVATVPINTSITITANAPAAGKEFASWSITSSGGATYTIGSNTTTPTSFTGTAIGGHTITALYRDIAATYDLTVVNGTGGGTGIPVNTSSSITASTPPVGQVFKWWTGDICVGENCASARVVDRAADPGSFISSQAGAYTVTAVFYTPPPVNNFSLTVVNGTQTGNDLGIAGVYECNTQVNITADPPQEGYVFDRWVVTTNANNTSVIGSATSTPTTFTSTQVGVYTVTATYKQANAYYTLSMGPNGNIDTPQTDPNGFNVGQTINISANPPPEGQEFSSWNGDDDSKSKVGNLLSQSTTFTGTAAKTYQLSVVYSNVTVNNWSVTMTDGKVNDVTYAVAPVGTSLTIVADPPQAGFKFKEWVITGAAATNYEIGSKFNSTTTLRSLIIGVYSATATYEADIPPSPSPSPSPPATSEYTLDVIDGTGSGSATVGTGITVTADDKTLDGYRFNGWTGDIAFLANSGNSSTIFTGTSETTYSIAASYVYVGDINLDVTNGTGSGTYSPGSSVGVSADAPLPGERFLYWIGDTQYLSNPASASPFFTAPPGNYSIEAVFGPDENFNTYTLTVENGSGTGTYQLNETAVAIYDNINGGFQYWQGDTQYITSGSVTSTSVSFKPTGPGDYTLIANFTG